MSGNLNPSDSGQKHKFGFRLFIGGIALFIGAKTWDLFAEKYGGETPDWLLIVFLVIAGLAGVYWLVQVILLLSVITLFVITPKWVYLAWF